MESESSKLIFLHIKILIVSFNLVNSNNLAIQGDQNGNSTETVWKLEHFPAWSPSKILSQVTTKWLIPTKSCCDSSSKQGSSFATCRRHSSQAQKSFPEKSHESKKQSKSSKGQKLRRTQEINKYKAESSWKRLFSSSSAAWLLVAQGLLFRFGRTFFLRELPELLEGHGRVLRPDLPRGQKPGNHRFRILISKIFPFCKPD